MRRDPEIALKLAGLGVVGVVAVWLLAFHGPGRTLDQHVADGFTGLQDTRISTLTHWVPHLSDPQPFLLWFLLIVGAALWRHRPRLAAMAAVVLLGSSLTTAIVKPLITFPRWTRGVEVGPNAFPSGHATASMAVALCAVLVTPRRFRPLVATLAAGYTIAVTFTLLVAAWHFPSDVAAGYLVAGSWTALGVAALLWLEERRPASVRTPTDEPLDLRAALQPVLAVAGAAAAAALLALLVRPEGVLDYARHHTFFVVGAAVLGSLALALVGFLAAAAPTFRRPPHAS